MLAALRDALVVARFDLAASLRSRKALVLLGLYLAGSVAASAGFVELLEAIEKTAADTLQVASTGRPGTMTASVMESEQLLQVVQELVGDEDLARELLAIPPLALFQGWLALTFVPVLVTLTSSEAIASEVGSGAARFALVRTTRGAWAAGKLLGQAALMAAGLLLGAAGCWVVGAGWTAGFEPIDNAWWMLRLSLRACLVGFAWLGIVLGAGQLTRSANKARALGLLSLVGVAGLRLLLAHAEPVRQKAPALADSLLPLFPGSHVLDLWQPALLDRLPAMAMLLALGGAAFTLGHLVFARRDG